ncbi:hypothetical protein L5515_010544 [Caenorhabditis briggsae]|uniref:Uncharacterized protein n=1 Tax=Caenorhabditis briggsae TaxID=6238 RepID=A0AAE9ERK6_CAEBR|nr:hypothetical protein L5515_010544 [Caenorhabditis briggsae]
MSRRKTTSPSAWTLSTATTMDSTTTSSTTLTTSSARPTLNTLGNSCGVSTPVSSTGFACSSTVSSQSWLFHSHFSSPSSLDSSPPSTCSSLCHLESSSQFLETFWPNCGTGSCTLSSIQSPRPSDSSSPTSTSESTVSTRKPLHHVSKFPYVPLNYFPPPVFVPHWSLLLSFLM